MKKCQTEKEISIEDYKTEREGYFNHDHFENHGPLSTKKLSIPVQHPTLNNKIILTNKKKQKKKNITNILTSDTNTISNISLNNNSIINYSNNLCKSNIYKKKRIPVPKKGSLSREKDIYPSIGIKKKYINIKKNLNINNNGIENERDNSNKVIKFDEKNEKSNMEHKSHLIPKIYDKNNKKNISMDTNDIYNNNKEQKIKKFLYLHNNMNSININNNQKKSMSDRHLENQKKRVNSNNHKKIDLYKINKINNINNININLNNINNKIEYNDIMKNLNSCRNDNRKFQDLNFLKKLNFDQPEKYNLLGLNTLIDNHSLSKDLLNNNNESIDRIKYNNNYIYKNNNTLNANRNIKTNENINMLNKKILYKLEPKIITPLILTPRNKPCQNILKEKNKICNSPENNNSKYKYNINKSKNIKFDTENENHKNYSIPYQISKNKKNNKRIDLFDYQPKNSNNIIKSDNINRINIFVNNGNDKNSNKSKNINININSNFNQNIVTNESLTILNSSNSDIPSYMNSNDITQIESEKDEKNNVLSSYQLNLYLNEAKKSNPKNININNISNKPINKALLYISNSNKYHTDINNKNKNKNNTVDLMENDNSLYQRNYKNENIIYDYNTRTYHPKSKNLKLNNILFISINTNFKLLLLKFLDKKSLLILSSLNKSFYKNFRKKVYKYFYENIIKNNENKNFIMKILNTIPRYASKILKSNNAKNLKNKYEYYKKNKSIYNDIILQDIKRTFPNDPSFKIDSINYKKLFNLLTSYSNYNKSIGYAQGLNFLAASSIFLFKNEEKVFIFLDGLINRFKLNNLLSINNQNLPKRLKYFSYILNKYCSEFINHLNSKLLNHEFFSTSWLLTLFSNSMERNKLFICWSFMVIFGWKFFYSFVVELLLFYKKTLLEIKETELSLKMKELLKRKQFIKDFNEIIKNTLTFMENHIIL